MAIYAFLGPAVWSADALEHALLQCHADHEHNVQPCWLSKMVFIGLLPSSSRLATWTLFIACQLFQLSQPLASCPRPGLKKVELESKSGRTTHEELSIKWVSLLTCCYSKLNAGLEQLLASPE